MSAYRGAMLLRVHAACFCVLAACSGGNTTRDGAIVDDAPPDGPPPILEEVHLIGRFDAMQRFQWPGSEIRTRFVGTEISIELSETGSNYFEVTIDGAQLTPLRTTSGRRAYVLATGLADGEHDVRIARRTEGFFSVTTYHGFPGATLVETARPARFIEFIGDSITCGYGVLGTTATCDFSADTEAETRAWATLAADALDAGHASIAYSGLGMYRNGDGGTTNTIPVRYDRALVESATPAWDWSYTPDVIVINLGTNDFAPGDPGTPYVTAYVAFVQQLTTRFPSAKVLMATSPMLGDGFPAGQMHRTKARNYLDLAAAMIGDPDVSVVEIAEQRAADGYGCDYHPNVATNQIMTTAITAEIRRVTGWQ
jgi:lysophospholipase L1-like esterase